MNHERLLVMYVHNGDGVELFTEYAHIQSAVHKSVCPDDRYLVAFLVIHFAVKWKYMVASIKTLSVFYIFFVFPNNKLFNC